MPRDWTGKWSETARDRAPEVPAGGRKVPMYKLFILNDHTFGRRSWKLGMIAGTK